MRSSTKILICIFFCLPCINAFTQTANDTWAVKFSNALIFRYQPTVNTLTNKGWEYSNTIMTHGMEKVFNQVPDSIKYRNYIQAYIDTYVNGSGAIAATINSLDRTHPGISCLFLYEKTGLLKYKTAATTLRNMYVGPSATYPKTATGKIFWHKNNGSYNDIVLIDGIYMLHPFLTKYGTMFGDNAAIDTAVNQTLYVYYQLYDNSKHLIKHAWNPTKTQSWADPVTGNSSEVWSRGMGWFTMALVDILKYLPASHPRRGELITALSNLAIGIQTYQDAVTGLWYQVVDRGTSLANNYLETSGSAMFVYALKTGADSGWISSSFLPVAVKAWNYLKDISNVKISIHTDGYPKINDFAPAMGVQTSAANYVQASLQPVDCPGTAHPHGYGAILMTASVMEFPLALDTEPPSAPVLSSTGATATTISLSWTAATDNVGVTGYEVYANGSLKTTTTGLTYTITGLTASTAYDIYVRAKDAAGNGTNSNTISVTTQSGGSTTILAHYFETGWDGWADGGDDCARYGGSRSYQGSYSIYIRDNSGTISAMTSSAYNVSAWNQLVIDFYFYAYSMENGEDFWVRYYNGSSWSTVATYIAGTNFNNNGFYHATVTLTNVTFPANAQFRFQCDASDNSDLIYIDQVTVTGSNTALRTAHLVNTQTCEKVGLERVRFETTDISNYLVIYPNPAKNNLAVQTGETISDLKIYDVNGSLMNRFANVKNGSTLDIAALKAGLYIISFKTKGGKLFTRKFIKQ